MNDKTDLIERVLRVLSAMGEDDAAPKSRQEIAVAADVPDTTTWRILKRLRAESWVVYDDESATWTLGTPVLVIAHAHRRGTARHLAELQARVRHVETEFESIAREPIHHA